MAAEPANPQAYTFVLTEFDVFLNQSKSRAGIAKIEYRQQGNQHQYHTTPDKFLFHFFKDTNLVIEPCYMIIIVCTLVKYKKDYQNSAIAVMSPTEFLAHVSHNPSNYPVAST